MELAHATADRILAMMFDCNPQPMWIYQVATQAIVAVNDAAVRKYGYRREEFLDLTLHRIEVVAPDRHHRAVHKTAAGDAIEVEISAESMSYEGEPCMIAGMRDITPESAMRRELMKREAWYRCLIEHTTGIITILDREGILRYASPSVSRVLGLPGAGILGQSLPATVHPDDARACSAAIAELLKDFGRTASLEFRLPNASGEWLVFEAFGHNLLNEPAIQGIVVYGHDISHRRHAQQELLDTNDRLRLAQRAGQVGTWECCTTTGKLCFSPEAARLHGIVPPFDPSDVLDRIHPQDQVRFRTALGIARLSGSLDLEDYRVIWPDRSEHWLHARGEVLRYADRARTRLLAVVTDVTARKQAEKDAADLRDQALEASRLKSQFLATVSHEIRTPMNGIIGMTGLLLDSNLTTEQQNDADIIRTSALYLLDLINDLLDFSRIEAGKVVMDSTTFDLHDCLTTVVDLLAPEAAARGLRLELEYPPGLPRTWMGPVGRIRQIVLNYAANAVKFTEHGSVRITASAQGDASESCLKIAVSDTGPGIDMTAQLRLFSKFVQLDASHTRKHGGTGLGLAISKALAEAMGGKVGVRSQVGQGSEFWVELPLHPSLEPVAPAPPPAVTAPLRAVRASRILVAEDNLVNQKLAVRLLEKRGHRVDVAADGREAIQMWSQFPYDMIFMDCQMPEVDGLEAVRHIRRAEGSSGNHIPIVALTAHATADDTRRCLEVGMDGVLTKPFQPSALEEILAMTLKPVEQPDSESRPLGSELDPLPEPSLRSGVPVP